MTTGPHSEPADLPGLERFTFPPTGSHPLAGSAVMVHGHGDYASRYEEVLLPFRERGIACVATDLPGHGQSSGKRGAIPGTAEVDAVLTSDLERARSYCPDGPVGLFGHSAGGLLALRELLRRPDTYSFAWISSPLLWPERARHPFLVTLLRTLGMFLPGLRVSTGVTSDMCWHGSGDENESDEEPAAGEGDGENGFHRLINLGWARKLIAVALEVRSEFPTRKPRIPILFTQGSIDPVCPAPLLRAFLEELHSPIIRHVEFEGLLHEPFADPRKAELAAALTEWFDEVRTGLE